MKEKRMTLAFDDEAYAAVAECRRRLGARGLADAIGKAVLPLTGLSAGSAEAAVRALRRAAAEIRARGEGSLYAGRLAGGRASEIDRLADLIDALSGAEGAGGQGVMRRVRMAMGRWAVLPPSWPLANPEDAEGRTGCYAVELADPGRGEPLVVAVFADCAPLDPALMGELLAEARRRCSEFGPEGGGLPAMTAAQYLKAAGGRACAVIAELPSSRELGGLEPPYGAYVEWPVDEAPQSRVEYNQVVFDQADLEALAAEELVAESEEEGDVPNDHR